MARGTTTVTDDNNPRIKLVERNGVMYAACPTCSKNYPVEDRGVPIDPPTDCRRCRGPMDPRRALDYGNTLAERDHQPQLTALGNRIRGLQAAGATA